MGARRTDLAVLAILLAALLAWPLHTPPITTRGEAREGLVVRDVVRNGNWVIARRAGTLASKPPLFHWIAAGAGRIFGLGDVVMRLPSALATIVLAGTTLVLGTLVGGREVGWLAVAILGATSHFWTSAVEARVDMLFTAAVTLALAGFLVWYRGGRAGRPVFYAATAAAVLTKGPAGAALPALAVVLFLAWQGDLARLRALWSPVLGAATVLVVGGWYVAAYRTAGSEFVAVHILHENVHRLIGGGAYHRTRLHALKLPAAFVTHLAPWNLVLPWAAWRWWRGERLDPLDRFLHAWWLAVVGVFAFASRTRAVYFLPAYPAVALLAARALAPRLKRGAMASIGAVAVGLLVATAVSRLHAARRNPLPTFAARIRPLIAPETRVETGATLLENEALVLRYLLDHSLPRSGPLRCEPGVLVLVPWEAVEKATGLGFRMLDATGPGPSRTALIECPRAPTSVQASGEPAS